MNVAMMRATSEFHPTTQVRGLPGRAKTNMIRSSTLVGSSKILTSPESDEEYTKKLFDMSVDDGNTQALDKTARSVRFMAAASRLDSLFGGSSSGDAFSGAPVSRETSRSDETRGLVEPTPTLDKVMSNVTASTVETNDTDPAPASAQDLGTESARSTSTAPKAEADPAPEIDAEKAYRPEEGDSVPEDDMSPVPSSPAPEANVKWTFSSLSDAEDEEEDRIEVHRTTTRHDITWSSSFASPVGSTPEGGSESSNLDDEQKESPKFERGVYELEIVVLVRNLEAAWARMKENRRARKAARSRTSTGGAASPGKNAGDKGRTRSDRTEAPNSAPDARAQGQKSSRNTRQWSSFFRRNASV